MDRKSRETVNCCVPSCKATLESCKDASFYSFPKERNLRESWITALRHMDMYSEIIRDLGPRAISRMFVCSSHFTLKDFKSALDEDVSLKGIKAEDALVKRSLCEGAVPSIFSNKFERKVGRPRKDSLTTTTARAKSKEITTQEIKAVTDQMKYAVKSIIAKESDTNGINDGEVVGPIINIPIKQPKPRISTRTSSRLRTQFVPYQNQISTPTKNLPKFHSPPSMSSNNTRVNLPTSTSQTTEDSTFSKEVKPDTEVLKIPVKSRIQKKKKVSKAAAITNSYKKRRKYVRRKPLKSPATIKQSACIIATALSRLSQVPVVGDRPTTKLRKKLIRPTSTSTVIIPKKEKELKDPLNISEEDLTQEISDPPTTLNSDNLPNGCDPVRTRGRPRKIKSLPVSPTKSIKLTSVPPVHNPRPRSEYAVAPYSEILLSNYPPERKETGLIESMFSSAITKVFANPRAPGRPGRKKKPQKNSNFGERDNDGDFIHGDLSADDKYEFAEYNNSPNYVEDPLDNENGYEYATPLLNGFGIVTDDNQTFVEVKSEHVQEDSKLDPDSTDDEFEILPEVETEMTEDDTAFEMELTEVKLAASPLTESRNEEEEKDKKSFETETDVVEQREIKQEPTCIEANEEMEVDDKVENVETKINQEIVKVDETSASEIIEKDVIEANIDDKVKKEIEVELTTI